MIPYNQFWFLEEDKAPMKTRLLLWFFFHLCFDLWSLLYFVADSGEVEETLKSFRWPGVSYVDNRGSSLRGKWQLHVRTGSDLYISITHSYLLTVLLLLFIFFRVLKWPMEMLRFIHSTSFLRWSIPLSNTLLLLDAMSVSFWCGVQQIFKMTKQRIIILYHSPPKCLII